MRSACGIWFSGAVTRLAVLGHVSGLIRGIPPRLPEPGTSRGDAPAVSEGRDDPSPLRNAESSRGRGSRPRQPRNETSHAAAASALVLSQKYVWKLYSHA